MSEAWAIFGAVAAAHALGVASPGPDFAVVIRMSLAQGQRAGVFTALGIGSGIVFHVAWGMFGLGWAVQRFPALLDTLRYAGAAYLFWMGVQALRSQPGSSMQDETAQGAAPSLAHAYLSGLATNLLNVKALLFFVALCSSVITADAPPALRIALGLWLVLATVAWFSAVASTAGHPKLRARLVSQAHRIDHAMGLLLIALALGISVSGEVKHFHWLSGLAARTNFEPVLLQSVQLNLRIDHHNQ